MNGAASVPSVASITVAITISTNDQRIASGLSTITNKYRMPAAHNKPDAV